NWTEIKNEDGAPSKERVLFLSGAIAEESWFDDEVTPKIFKDELMAGNGDITVWINSPGGDCVAAAQIYNMLIDYPHSVTIKIDGLAASAASVIAMAGTKVLMSPVGLLMIHNPLTMVAGDSAEMQKAIEMLDSVKESIINAYELKTGLSRNKLSRLMDEETWMDARKAMELGFIDGILEPAEMTGAPIRDAPVMYSRKSTANELRNRISARMPKKEEKDGRRVEDLLERLHLIEN
ncbi:MAG: Clp protease ClpP, partial [Spirochaetales bacterium]|nr:Clp protease ClpP [Candidatus Physcosoma equi]